jgi:hypothetical protein
MAAALEDVCQALKVERNKQEREVLAIRIIDLARDGERDRNRLRERVLKEASRAGDLLEPVPIRCPSVTIVRCNCGAEYRRTEEKFLVPHAGDAICAVCGAALESWSESTHVPIYEPIERPDRKPE